MAIVTGILGGVSWSGGNPQSGIVSANQFQSFTLDWDNDTFDEPYFSGGAAPNTLRGLNSWRGTLEAYSPNVDTGVEGLVTWATGYTANVYEWSLNVTIQEHDVTTFQSGVDEPSSKIFILGRYTYSLELGAYADSSTQIVSLPKVSDPAAITLRYEDSLADGQFDCSSIINNQNVTVDPNTPNGLRISCVGHGALSSTGTTPIIPSGAYDVGDFRTLVLTETTGQTLSGSAAITSINFRCNVQEPMRLTVGFRGTDDLTPALT